MEFLMELSGTTTNFLSTHSLIEWNKEDDPRIKISSKMTTKSLLSTETTSRVEFEQPRIKVERANS